jgi:group I intron endonuclease
MDGLSPSQSGVYIIRNELTGQAYIGCSINIYQRFKQHRSGHGGADLISQAMADSKIEFSLRILELCDPDAFKDREHFYISDYDTLAPNGYNVSPGGGSVLRSYEQKMALSAKMQARTPEQIAAHMQATGDALRDPDRRLKASETAKAQWADPTMRQNALDAAGDPDLRARRSEMMKKAHAEGRYDKMTFEARSAASKKGLTPEARAKMSAAQKRRYSKE